MLWRFSEAYSSICIQLFLFFVDVLISIFYFLSRSIERRISCFQWKGISLSNRIPYNFFNCLIAFLNYSFVRFIMFMPWSKLLICKLLWLFLILQIKITKLLQISFSSFLKYMFNHLYFLIVNISIVLFISLFFFHWFLGFVHLKKQIYLMIK
jgi:hypothetical protein